MKYCKGVFENEHALVYKFLHFCNVFIKKMRYN